MKEALDYMLICANISIYQLRRNDMATHNIELTHEQLWALIDALEEKKDSQTKMLEEFKEAANDDDGLGGGFGEAAAEAAEVVERKLVKLVDLLETLQHELTNNKREN